MSTPKPWLPRNYLLVILICLLLAALIWWIFHQRIRRIENELQKNQQQTTLLYMPEKTIPGRMILLPDNAGIAVVDTASIIRIQAISNYSKLFFANGKKLVVAKVLKRFEQELSSNGFIRPHRTHLVNKKFIVRYIDGEAGKIELSTGELIDVSKRRKPGFLNVWRMYAGSLSPL